MHYEEARAYYELGRHADSGGLDREGQLARAVKIFQAINAPAERMMAQRDREAAS
jgi:hypothetical protein